MPTNLTYLFCTPNDVYERIGVAAAQLRLDDAKVGTGQTITNGAAAAVGATSLTIAALQYPMLRGDNLVFSMAAMDGPVEATLSAAYVPPATSLAITALATAIPAGATATDNGTNVWLAGMLTKACQYATAQVMNYCAQRYNANVLQTDWNVNRWAVALACKWLGTRAFQAEPAGVSDDYEQAMLELKEVQQGKMLIGQLPLRTAGWPAMSNLTLQDVGTYYTRLRVESVISDPVPTQYPQNVDYGSLWGVWW